MALSVTPAPIVCRFPVNPRIPAAVGSSISFATLLNRRKIISFRCLAVSAVPASGNVAPAVSLTDKAWNHLNKIRSERNEDLCLRIGVKQGGCSGMSYTMEFDDRANTRSGDSVIEYDGFAIVCDPKSLLFIYGMQLDFSDALIGGGFSFKNPNAMQTCSCGKSFSADKSSTSPRSGQCL